MSFDNYCFNILDIADSTRCPISVWSRLHEGTMEKRKLASLLYSGSVYTPELSSGFEQDSVIPEGDYLITDEVENIICDVKNSWKDGMKTHKVFLECNKPILIGHDVWSKFHDIFFESDGREVYAFLRLYDLGVKRSSKAHIIMGHLFLRLVQDLFSGSDIHGVVWQHEHNRKYFTEVEDDIITETWDIFIHEILEGNVPSFIKSRCKYCSAKDYKDDYCAEYRLAHEDSNTDSEVSL